MCVVINRVCYKKLPEQLGFHSHAVSTHPEELVFEPPPLKNPGSACDNIYATFIYITQVMLDKQCVRSFEIY